MANNRELSQLASLIVVDDTTRNIGIATTGFSNIGIGTTNPLGRLQIGTGTTTFIVTGTGSTVLVGIGTTNPIHKLHLNDSTSNQVALALQNSNTGGNSWLLQSSGGSATNGQGKFSIYDTNASQYRLVINSSGDVGIGTTNPGARLRIDDPNSTQTYSQRVIRTQTDFASRVGVGVNFEDYQTTSGTRFASGSNSVVSTSVAAGVTNSGYIRGGLDGVWRNNNNANSSTDNGTLDYIIGRTIQLGHYNDSVVSPITNNVTGLQITPYAYTGSIGNFTGVNVSSVATAVGATVTNVYGLRSQITTTDGTNPYNLYIDGAAKNYIAGDVGIGTTNPVTPLHISDGNGGISTALYTSDLLTISAQNSAPGFNIIAAGSAATQRGVFKATRSRGTLSSPTVPLTNDNTFSLLGVIYDGSTGRSTAAINMDVDGDVGVGTAPQRITFWTGTGSSRLERARIQSTGEVLIGSATSTGTASQTLQVTGGAYFSGSVGIGTTRPVTNLNVRVDQDDETSIRVNNNTDGANAYSAVIAGNDLGGFVYQINASSRTNTRFGSSIGGFAEIYTSGSFTGSGIKFGTLTAHPIIIGTNNTEAIRIDSSQRVGIGTTNPTSKLQVNGVISLGRTDNSGITSIRSVIDTISWEHAGVKKSVTTEDLNPQELFFKDDGTKMFIVGSTGDRVYEYALGTAWDVSSAGFTTFFSVATQDTSPVGLFFRPNGLNMYVSGQTGVAPLFASGDYVHQYTLGTAWDISNAGAATVGWTTSFRVLEDSNPFAVYFKDDGTKMFVAGNTNQRIYEYALGTAWNVSTAGLTTSILIGTGTTQNLPLTLTQPTGLAFNASGTQMFISDSDRDVVARFNLRTAWDLNTAVFYDNVYVGFQDLNPSGIFYQENQSKAYITGNGTDTVYQYNTNVPSLELESSGISTRSSVVVNNETRLNDRLYVTGDTHVNSNTTLKGTLTVDGASTLTGAVSIAGGLTVSGGTISAGNNATSLLIANTTTAVNFFTGQTSGAFTFGGTSGTGTITLGRATTSQQTDIQAGVTASGNTKTINLGTGGASGSFTRIAVGPSLGIGTVIINSGTNLGIGTSVPTSALHVVGDVLVTGVSTIVANSSTEAFRITQTGTGNAFVVEDATNPDATPFVIMADGKVGVGTTGMIQYGSGASDTSTFGILASTGNDSAFVLKGNNGSTTDGSGQTLAIIVGSTGGTGSGTILTHISHNTSGIGTRRNSIRFTDTQIRFEDNVSGSVDVTINSSGSGELLVGRTSSTGTSNQLLQVEGGAYILDSVGIGTTIPTSKLSVVGDVLVTGITTSTDFNSSSDINLKDNIQRIENPIDKVLQLDGVTFNWKETNRPSVGVVAQQVEKVLPQLVSGDQTKTVNYNGLIALLIECVKEQQIEINNLKEKLK
jgi:hypothetical protein